jgi:hypothetical protein
MRRESTFAVFLLSLLFFATIGEISAQTTMPSPGVAPGNVFTYDFFAFWNSTDQTAKLPADLVELNKTETIRLTITQVSGLMVLMNITSRFENGTENMVDGMVNIMSGSSIRAFGLIVSPKLVTYNVVYPYGDFNFTINGTAIRTYSFGERETAYYISNSSDADYVYNYKSMYFDRETGVMLENYMEQVTTSNPNETRALLWKIKEFDLRTIGGGILDYWPIIAGAVAVVVVLVAVILYRRKNQRKRRHRK